HGLETDAASLGCDPSPSLAHAPPPLAMADCAVSTDMLGDAGTPPSPTPMRIAALMCCAAVKGPPAAAAGGRSWHVAEEMAEARETGMRQRPFPCRYCMAAPMSSSISLATCCSVTVRPSLPSAAPAAAPPRPSEDMSATSGATAAAPPSRLMLSTCACVGVDVSLDLELQELDVVDDLVQHRRLVRLQPLVGVGHQFLKGLHPLGDPLPAKSLRDAVWVGGLASPRAHPLPRRRRRAADSSSPGLLLWLRPAAGSTSYSAKGLARHMGAVCGCGWKCCCCWSDPAKPPKTPASRIISTAELAAAFSRACTSPPDPPLPRVSGSSRPPSPPPPPMDGERPMPWRSMLLWWPCLRSASCCSTICFAEAAAPPGPPLIWCCRSRDASITESSYGPPNSCCCCCIPSPCPPSSGLVPAARSCQAEGGRLPNIWSRKSSCTPPPAPLPAPAWPLRRSSREIWPAAAMAC
uniref:Uncharacterized protein n=1 Tax=Aegilops tauschii subsp. strangulata TaxID=200361 RepID=A0A453KXG2_AEGTS